MQAIYYPKAKTEVKQGESFHLVSCHDEYSLWFDVVKTPVSSTDPISLPNPEPGLHLAMSRTRLGQVNNKERNEKFVKNIKHVLENSNKDKTVLVISEQSLLGLMVAKLGAENVIHISNAGCMTLSSVNVPYSGSLPPRLVSGALLCPHVT